MRPAARVASLADLVVIPCRPTAFDLAATGSAVEIVKAVRARAVFVLPPVQLPAAGPGNRRDPRRCSRLRLSGRAGDHQRTAGFHAPWPAGRRHRV